MFRNRLFLLLQAIILNPNISTPKSRKQESRKISYKTRFAETGKNIITLYLRFTEIWAYIKAQVKLGTSAVSDSDFCNICVTNIYSNYLEVDAYINQSSERPCWNRKFNVLKNTFKPVKITSIKFVLGLS